ncbi:MULTISPECIES: porin [Kaistia]|uniref:Porin n=1 Tax=Kaistia nematophila TaxID=2994654 RepID=A0A9X3E1E8_9HYPH|nr:porin [Kaistia nematophila]MBN9058761.1 porin [Hyphomicrobiales bacterium]MCX5568867.1 porin [Kaistia nematophila]
MNFKSLLLGSAAAIVLAGGAQAADLTIAEPVDYVKVCDAFGAGFFYSPGTDTCIKVGGYVEFGTSFGGGDFGGLNSSNNNWGNFYTEVSIQLTASSVTEYGNLTGFIDMRAKTANKGGETGTFSDLVNESTNSAYVDSAYLELGPIKAGYFTSLFDFGRGYDDTGMFGSDSTTDHIQLTYAVNGFGLALSIEDQRDRGAYGNAIINGVDAGNENIPDIIAALTYTSGIFSAKVAGAYTNSAIDYITLEGQDGWAIGGGLEIALDSFSAGDRFFVSAAYGDNANSFTGISGGTSVAGAIGDFDNSFASGTGSSWSALASYKHVWTPQLWSSLSGGYASFDGSDSLNDVSLDAWRVGFNTAYTPVKGLDLVADVFYTDVDVKDAGVSNSGDSWTANLFLQRHW